MPAAAEKNLFLNQVIWITGASSGIGEGLVRAFSGCGANVVLSSRRESELRRVRDECIQAGASAGSLLLLPLDVTDYAAMPAAVQSVVDAFGRIDMLINNAGTSQRSFCIDTDMQVYRQMLELNVLGQIALTKAVLPLMAAPTPPLGGAAQGRPVCACFGRGLGWNQPPPALPASRSFSWYAHPHSCSLVALLRSCVGAVHAVWCCVLRFAEI